MRRFSDRAGHGWVAIEAERPDGLPDRRKGAASSVQVAFQCDDGTQVAMDLPADSLLSMSDQELLFLLSRGIKQ
ncbi:MAG: hypothetical protein H0W63_08405 [Gemmatimonadaceae bacterium]|nr:hypothetical protein [Gemmatimonadaceae bacterium]